MNSPSPRPPEGPWNGIIPEGWEEYTGPRIKGLWCALSNANHDSWDECVRPLDYPLVDHCVYIRPISPSERKEEVETKDVHYLLVEARVIPRATGTPPPYYEESVHITEEEAIRAGEQAKAQRAEREAKAREIGPGDWYEFRKYFRKCVTIDSGCVTDEDGNRYALFACTKCPPEISASLEAARKAMEGVGK